MSRSIRYAGIDSITKCSYHVTENIGYWFIALTKTYAQLSEYVMVD